MTTDQQHGAAGRTGDREPAPGRMRAIVQDRYGTAEVLRTGWVPRPTIGDNEVLVRVHAAGLDRGAWHLMTGTPYLIRLGTGLRGPRNPVIGSDVAGTVTDVGRAVTAFRVGEEVFGAGKGSFAEYAVAREDRLAHKPAGVTFEQAAVVPVSALTALQALRDAGRVAQGQKVLILGASGGVGSYAVQLARAFGAETTGVCGTGKLDFVCSLGADHVLDYTRDDFADGARRYDLILDIGGNPELARLRRALKPRGTAVLVGGEGGGTWTGIGRQLRAVMLSPFVPQRLVMLMSTQRSSDLRLLAGLIEDGTVTPRVGSSYPLDQVPDAMRYLEAGKARGKTAITL
ncbi:NAD(P)-dependent alcohol dehydrogenase [Arthrobacter sp. Br18]|uniref:NAD(P)-dependent alcohol dehydrogenase n=1 Tax=Arthrobacter sp. Br18 TaxID=1312954 RepID=UPI0004B5F633|nr:NAD(P)-dependent alcohol dehydrogenase [Arthrobacter sp. Br18]